MYKNRIREVRESKGLSQTKLACQIRMSGSTLSALETGKRCPWPKARRAIAQAISISENDLFLEGYTNHEN
jgi:transcriptional regulator with XRE-family HTH domain